MLEWAEVEGGRGEEVQVAVEGVVAEEAVEAMEREAGGLEAEVVAAEEVTAMEAAETAAMAMEAVVTAAAATATAEVVMASEVGEAAAMERGEGVQVVEELEVELGVEGMVLADLGEGVRALGTREVLHNPRAVERAEEVTVAGVMAVEATEEEATAEEARVGVELVVAERVGA